MNVKPDFDENELLRQMRAGNEDAFVAIYRERHAAVYRFALQMCGSTSIAEDVTQEVFMLLMRGGVRYDSSRGSLSAFLLGIARNYVLRRFRRDGLLVPLTDQDEETAAAAIKDTGVFDGLARAETITTVRRAILSLPERYREVIVLCELQELSYVEAAQVLGCAIGTVRSRLHRGRALLLEKLRPSRKEDERDVSSARCFA
ncbi:MAG: RNA polymerase sigma factor [Pyrinomonadaceae bacterium]